MARFNTTQSTISVTGATTFTYVIDGATILLTGTSGYTVTLAPPASFVGTIQNIFNNTGGNVTIASGGGANIIGNGFTAATSQIIPNNTTYSVTSNGTAYVISNNQGGPISVTTGTFSGTLTANSTVSLSPANANVTASPTGSGTVTINPATAGAIDNVAIGGTTRAAGKFTTLDANNAVGLSPANQTVTISPTGTGTVAMSPATTGEINNTNIGSTTRATGKFTTLDTNSTVTVTGGTTSTNSTSGQLQVTGGVGISERLNVGGAIAGASIQSTPVGSVTRSSGAFTSLAADNGLSVTGGSVSTSATVTSTFSGPVIVPDPTANTHAANKNFVINRIIWSTAAGIGTVNANTSGAYSFTVTASSVGGSAVSYALQSGALPSGGSLNTSNGTISGTSTAGSGTSTGYSFTIRATVGTLFEDRAFTVTVNVPVPTGQALYEGTNSNSNGGTTAYTWIAPAGVNTVSVAAIGGGGGGCYAWAVCGGAGGGLAWANGVPVTPGSSYTIQAGNGGCWNGSQGGCSCFPNIVACGGCCGCYGGSYTVGGTFSACCGSCGMVAYNNTAGGGGGGGGYANNLCNQVNSGYVGCYGGGGSAASHHSSTHGTGGGGGTGIKGQGNNGACSNPSVGHGTSGGGGQGGSGGSTGCLGEPYSNGNGNGFACGGCYGGGGGGGGTSQGGGWGGRGAVRIIWGPGRAYPSTGTADA